MTVNADIECQARYAALAGSATPADRSMANLATRFRICAYSLLHNISAEDDKTLKMKHCLKDARRESRTRFCWSIYVLAVAEFDARNFAGLKPISKYFVNCYSLKTQLTAFLSSLYSCSPFSVVTQIAPQSH
jgi:hypothetical protein